MNSSLRRLSLTGLLLLLVLAVVLDLSAGAARIPLHDIFRILFTPSPRDDASWAFILSKIRLPKAMTAILAGCGLSVGGLQMQTLFRNPLADPGVLGITAGASLGVAAVMLTGGMTSIYALKELGASGSWLLACAACVGAGMAMLLVLVLSGRLRDNVMMLIIGLMIGSVTLALISIWQYFSNPDEVKDYLLWTFGSLGGVTGKQLSILAGIVVLGLIASFLSSKMLDALLLGENYARSMGLTIRRARTIIVCTTSLLAGSITAFCGPIGFVGIAVPHLARLFFNTSSHRILVPVCCLIGAILLLLCDCISQWPGTQTVLPINIITSLVGAPLVIFLLVRRRNLPINAYR